MSEIEKLVEKLRNPKAGTRYEACELLRVAPTITPEAIEALEKVLHDTDPAIVESAASSLQGHEEITGLPGRTLEPQECRWVDLPIEYRPALLLPLSVRRLLLCPWLYSIGLIVDLPEKER
jgi:hypothetical protein